MGTGKTAVAKAVARDLDKEYVSIDDIIEAREKRAINDIFRDDGEPYFRMVEKEVVKEVSEKSDQVVDTGGGVVLDSENMDALRKNGIIICLWADPQAVYDRTYKQGHRPLLNVDDPMEKIKELLDHRKPFYERADFRVDTTKIDLDTVVKEIERIVIEEEKENTEN